MHATSVYCRRSAERRRRIERGFTLLELLVVLALTALLTGLVAPTAMRALDAARERGAVADVTAMLAGLPVRAFQGGRAFKVEGEMLSSWVPELPEGWRLHTAAPLRYSAAGVAEGGEVLLLVPGRAPLRWQIAPGTGAVDAPPR